MKQKPNFKNLSELQGMIDAYFDGCKGEMLKDPKTGAPVLDRQGRPVMLDAHPPTLSGLALALGFSSKEGLVNYSGKPPLQEALLRARSRLEQYAEEQLFSRAGSAGARFVLSQGGRPEPSGPDYEALAPGYDGIMARVRAKMEGGSGDGGGPR